MTAALPITVIMNAGSGNKDKAAIRAAMEKVLGNSGRDAELVVVRRPRDLSGLVRRAAQERPGILAAAGGDGTINAVAAVARERELPLAVVPLGTFNYFARRWGIPDDPAAALAVATEGIIRRVPVGQVNGRLFLNNASIGLYRRLIQTREAHKQRFGRNRLVALLSGLIALLRRHRTYRLRLDIDGQPLTLAALSMFFGRNALQMEQLGLDEAACVERGELAILSLPDVGRLEMLGLLFQGFLGRLEEAENLGQHCARRVEVDWLDGKSRRIWVAIDGELVECDLPLSIESIPDALSLVVPGPTGEQG